MMSPNEQPSDPDGGRSQRRERSPLVKKTVFFFLILLCAWTMTKMPFLMAYDPSSEYAHSVGLPATINLVNWIRSGYHGNKMKTPAVGFLLIHSVCAINTLLLVAATLIQPTWRRKYGVWTYPMAIVFGLHSLPASLEHKMWIPFSGACFFTILTAIWGLWTLCKYEENPLVSEKHLEQQHYRIAFGAFLGGFTELFAALVPNSIHYATTGTWPPSDYEGPNPKAGHTWYDTYIPERLGWYIFWILVLVTWVAIPMYMVSISAETPEDVIAKQYSPPEREREKEVEEPRYPSNASAPEQTEYGTAVELVPPEHSNGVQTDTASTPLLASFFH